MHQQSHFTVLRQHLAKNASSSGLDVGEIHGSLMMFSWVFLAAIGLWAHYFKHKIWGISLHAFSMGLLTLLTILAGFIAIIQFGLGSMSAFHIGLGIAIIIVVIIVASGGVLCHTLELQVGVKPIYVFVINRIHRFGGRIVIVMALVQLLSTYFKHIAQFILVIIFCVLPFIIFYILKYRSLKVNNMDNVSMASGQQNQSHQADSQKLRVIRNGKDLSIYKDNFYILADKVYPIQNIINSHPGGWQIINAVRGRQVDRYLYGMEPIQAFGKKQMVVKDHSDMALKMAGSPMAVLFSNSPYQGMEQVSTCAIEEVLNPCRNNKMYAVYLAAKGHDFKYGGYSSLDQLGKYFAVNINKNLTRLYCVVNFLHGSNLQLIEKILGRPISQSSKLIYYNNELKKIQANTPIANNLLPLFMKRYDNGEFTKQFTSGNFTKPVRVSKPRGRGLCLHQLPTGGVILMFAGGTGLNVYCDVIDLLFKQTLVGEKSPLSNELVAKNPILRQQTVGKFYYILYIAVQQISQIHPLTLLQLNYLAQKNKLKVFVKSKDQGINTIYQQNNSITRETRNFQTVLDQYFNASNQNIVQIYLCGPPAFSHAIISEFPRLNIDPTKYKVM